MILVHPDCKNPDCHKQDRGGACGLCSQYERLYKAIEKEVINHFNGLLYTSFGKTFSETTAFLQLDCMIKDITDRIIRGLN